MSYSYDLKLKAIQLYNKFTLREIAFLLHIGKSTISRWIKKFKQGLLVKKDQFRVCKSKLTIHEKTIINHVLTYQTITLQELQIWVKKTLDLKTSLSTLMRLLKKHKISYKTARREVIKSNTVALQTLFRSQIKNKNITQIVCLDEVGFQVVMKRRKGWSKIGERCIITDQKGGYTNYHGIFMINYKNGIKYKIYDKAINISRFKDFINSIIEPELLNKEVVMDNLRVHHNKEIIHHLKTKFTDILWTPPYSPELNPIEMLFSSLKSYLRGKEVSNKKELLNEINTYFSSVNTDEFLKYYNHSWN